MKSELNAPQRSFMAELSPVLIMAAILVPTYFVLPSKMMAAEILIMAIPTLSFILLLGYTGLLNFGTGSLFAVGAYTAGILLARHNVHILLAIIAGVAMSGIISIIMGYFCIKRVGLIFALLTLAFNQLIWFIIWQWKSFTGGPDGIWGIKREILELGIFSINLKPTFNFYIFVLILFLLLFLFVRRLIESPFGKVLMGMRESELRATAIGYNPETYKWIAFIIGGLICGLGGALFALHQEYVGEHLAHWSTSGEFAIKALLGGTFVLHGALIGSGVFIFLADFLNRFPVLAKAGAGLLVLGAIFILVVMFFRGGIYGGVEKVYNFFRKK
ncbi:MAG: branched-chain amino acid ABC transporter permease [Thermodesulfobacteriota bacterium]|nr:branched-chain amino acid ABC transporter permease [Thermodesulfobacteriota bacterium]